MRAVCTASRGLRHGPSVTNSVDAYLVVAFEGEGVHEIPEGRVRAARRKALRLGELVKAIRPGALGPLLAGSNFVSVPVPWDAGET